MASETLTQKALRYLSEDALSHIDMLEPLRRGTADVLYAGGDGVALYERNSGTCMLSFRGAEESPSFPDLTPYSLFAVHQKRLAERIRRERNLPHCFEVLQAAYVKKEPVAGDFRAIRALTPDHADSVSRHYEAMDDRDYIETLIGRRQLWGVFENGALAGFIGEHLEGSIGLLEVLPEYRRKGYGTLLEAYAIRHFLQRNEVPFCQVKTDNANSLALQRKLGMALSRRTTVWIYGN